MGYTIWRVGPDGEAFALSNMGTTSVKERALEKARTLNERLKSTEPESPDSFVVRDDDGKELRPVS